MKKFWSFLLAQTTYIWSLLFWNLVSIIYLLLGLILPLAIIFLVIWFFDLWSFFWEKILIKSITSWIDNWIDYALIAFMLIVIVQQLIAISILISSFKEASLKEILAILSWVLFRFFINLWLPVIIFLYICNSYNLDTTIGWFLWFYVYTFLISILLSFFWILNWQLVLCVYLFIIVYFGIWPQTSITKENHINKEITVSQDQNTLEWIVYQPASKQFSIKIPHEPKLTTTLEGWISDTNYSTTDQNMRIFYSIEHIILPKDTFNSPSLETWAKNARKSFHMVVEEDEITNNTWHVVWKIIPDENTEVFKWSNNGKVEMITRIQWNNIISARVAYDATLDRKYIDTFLNSFEIIWK